MKGEKTMLFGCCILPEEYQEADAAGFDFIELPGTALAALPELEFDQLRRTVCSGRTPCLAINRYCTEELPIAGRSVPQDEICRYAELVCGRAARLGAVSVGIGAPAARMLPENYDPALADMECRRFLTITAEAAGRYGLLVNFEQLHPQQCNYGNSTAEAVRLLSKIEEAEIGLVVDFYHRAAAGETEDDFTGFDRLIRHTHISTCGPHYERGYPNMSDLPYYTRLITALQKIGYQGAMSIEASSGNLAREGAESLRMLRAAEKAGGGI